jgi:hypothetical protein
MVLNVDPVLVIDQEMTIYNVIISDFLTEAEYR